MTAVAEKIKEMGKTPNLLISINLVHNKFQSNIPERVQSSLKLVLEFKAKLMRKRTRPLVVLGWLDSHVTRVSKGKTTRWLTCHLWFTGGKGDITRAGTRLDLALL